MRKPAKKTPGRPRRNPAEKPEQFSIRLTPPAKVMLEMMARDRNLSLSQTIQHLITDVANDYRIDGATLSETLFDRMAHASGAISEIEERFQPPSPEMAPLARQTALFNSRYGTLFLMPDRLLTADELALVRACFATGKLPSDDELATLHADSKTMITLGSSVDKATDYLIGRLSSVS